MDGQLLARPEVEVQDFEIGRFVDQQLLQAQVVEPVGFEEIDFLHDVYSSSRL